MRFLILLLLLVSCGPRFEAGTCIVSQDEFTEFTEPNTCHVRKILLVGEKNYLVKRPMCNYLFDKETGFEEIERSFDTYDNDQQDKFTEITCPKAFR